MSHMSLPQLNQRASTCTFLLKKKRLRPCGRGIAHERLHWQMYISKAKFKLNWFNCNSKLFALIYLNVCLFSARF